MSTFVKKILVSAVAAIVLATIAMPPAAQAQTAAELQAQIQSLLAQIAALQAQISGTTGGGGITGIPAGFTFTSNLSQGSSGVDVTHLQHLLNSNPGTQIASSGAGSPGQETQFFGPLTAAAVSKFQVMYASSILTPLGLTSGTGFFGASSRAKANTLLAAAPSPTPTPTPTPTPGTPAPSPTPITTPGAEGSLIVTISSTPASGAILFVGDSKDVAAIDVKATGSDVLVSRLDLQFDVRPYLYISEVTVGDGSTSKTMAVTQAGTSEITVGTKYSFRVEGLGIVVPKGTTKKLTVKVKTVSGLPAGTTTKNLVLTIIANAVRGTDGASLTQTAPTGDLATRTFTVKEGDTASLEISAAVDNPKARNVKVNTTAETIDVVLAKFTAKAKNNDAILRTLEFIDTTAGATAASSTLDVVSLYDGNTLLSSTSSITTASSTISDVNLTIPKDTTKTLTLKATLKKTSGNYEEGNKATITVGAEATSFAAEDATTFATATISGSNVVPGVAYFYSKSPQLALVSTSIVGLTGTTGSLSPQQAEAKIKINVTADGGDIYVNAYSATSGSSGLEGTTSVPASVTVSDSFTTNAASSTGAGGWLISSGDTKWFELNLLLTTSNATGNGAGFFVNAKPVNLIWTTADTDSWVAGMPQTWVLDDWKTSDIFLQGNL